MRADKCVTIALALLLSVTGSNAFAKVVADKDWVDALELDTLALTEDFIATFDSAEYQAAMDSCIQERYVIVEENKKYGIYDIEREDSVIPMDMDSIVYICFSRNEEGMPCGCFYFEKGLKCGKIIINMNNNSKTITVAYNPRLVGMEEDYPTIDPLIEELSYEVLCKSMLDIGGTQGQVAVIDAMTDDVLAWGALEQKDGDCYYAPLLKKFCSMETYMPFAAADCLAMSRTSLEDSVDTGQGVFILNDSVQMSDPYWRKGGYGVVTYRQALLNNLWRGMLGAVKTIPNAMDTWQYITDPAKITNAKEMATLFNNIFHLDSVGVEAYRRSYIRDIAIGMFKEGGIQHKHAPKNVELAGVYNVADDEKEQTFSFVGCFPADNPRYAVSLIVHRKHQLPALTGMVADKVNKLIEWLCKK